MQAVGCPENARKYRKQYESKIDKNFVLLEDVLVSSPSAAFEERIIGIENAVSAMLECKVKEDKIIQMLQKYWDLRLSEAKMFVEH